MARRKKYVSPIQNKFHREQHFVLETGRTIEHGEIIKIAGEHGAKFKFLEHVINKENGAEWVDCFQLEKGVVSVWRSFRPERIKPLPKRRVGKRVRND